MRSLAHGKPSAWQSTLNGIDGKDGLVIVRQVAGVNHRGISAKAILEFRFVTEVPYDIMLLAGPAISTELELKGAVGPFDAVFCQPLDEIWAVDVRARQAGVTATA